MSLSLYQHQITMPVRWGDMDRLGHVNNSKYLVYVEDGRVAYVNDCFPQGYMEQDWHQHGLILARVECDFKKPIVYPNQLIIGTRFVKMGGKSGVLETAIFTSNDTKNPAAVCEQTVVWMNYKANSSALWPEVVRQTIHKLEQW